MSTGRRGSKTSTGKDPGVGLLSAPSGRGDLLSLPLSSRETGSDTDRSFSRSQSAGTSRSRSSSRSWQSLAKRSSASSVTRQKHGSRPTAPNAEHKAKLAGAEAFERLYSKAPRRSRTVAARATTNREEVKRKRPPRRDVIEAILEHMERALAKAQANKRKPGLEEKAVTKSRGPPRPAKPAAEENTPEKAPPVERPKRKPSRPAKRETFRPPEDQELPGEGTAPSPPEKLVREEIVNRREARARRRAARQEKKELAAIARNNAARRARNYASSTDPYAGPRDRLRGQQLVPIRARSALGYTPLKKDLEDWDEVLVHARAAVAAAKQAKEEARRAALQRATLPALTLPSGALAGSMESGAGGSSVGRPSARDIVSPSNSIFSALHGDSLRAGSTMARSFDGVDMLNTTAPSPVLSPLRSQHLSFNTSSPARAPPGPALSSARSSLGVLSIASGRTGLLPGATSATPRRAHFAPEGQPTEWVHQEAEDKHMNASNLSVFSAPPPRRPASGGILTRSRPSSATLADRRGLDDLLVQEIEPEGPAPAPTLADEDDGVPCKADDFVNRTQSSLDAALFLPNSITPRSAVVSPRADSVLLRASGPMGSQVSAGSAGTRGSRGMLAAQHRQDPQHEASVAPSSSQNTPSLQAGSEAGETTTFGQVQEKDNFPDTGGRADDPRADDPLLEGARLDRVTLEDAALLSASDGLVLHARSQSSMHTAESPEAGRSPEMHPIPDSFGLRVVHPDLVTALVETSAVNAGASPEGSPEPALPSPAAVAKGKPLVRTRSKRAVFDLTSVHSTVNYGAILPTQPVLKDGALIVSNRRQAERIRRVREEENERIGIEESFMSLKRLRDQKRTAKYQQALRARNLVSTAAYALEGLELSMIFRDEMEFISVKLDTSAVIAAATLL